MSFDMIKSGNPSEFESFKSLGLLQGSLSHRRAMPQRPGKDSANRREEIDQQDKRLTFTPTSRAYTHRP